MAHAPDQPDQQALLLQINEVGGFLVFTGPSITIGPVGSPSRPDLAVLVDPSLPVLKVCRCQDDYLAYGQGQSTPILLSNGQKLALSQKAFFWFGLPNSASCTAVLTPVGLRLPRCDVQAVILAPREILIGPTKGHHIRTTHLDRTLTLLIRDGMIWAAKGPIPFGSSPLTERATPLAMDQPVQVPPLVLVISHWKPEV